jgi:hypothetical protein
MEGTGFYNTSSFRFFPCVLLTSLIVPTVPKRRMTLKSSDMKLLRLFSLREEFMEEDGGQKIPPILFLCKHFKYSGSLPEAIPEVIPWFYTFLLHLQNSNRLQEEAMKESQRKVGIETVSANLFWNVFKDITDKVTNKKKPLQMKVF